MPTLINKPLFSIIIPTYNPQNGLEYLLESLTHQGIDKNEYEIIISDDHSTIDYDNILSQFNNDLNIKKVQTEYNCCPGNTRQCGVQYATGQYITFADQDDIFVSNALRKVKNIFQQYPSTDILTTGLEYRLQYTDIILMVYNPLNVKNETGYLHGKYFHLQNFWKKYNLYFPKDLKSHQDIALTMQLILLQRYVPDEIVHLKADLITYIWCKHQNSLSNRTYYYKDQDKPRKFSNMFFNNYVNAILNLSLNYFKQNREIDKQEAFQFCCKFLFLIYQRSERDLYDNPIIIIQHYDYLYSVLIDMLQFFNKNINDIVNYFLSNPTIENYLKQYAKQTSSLYECKYNFEDWLNLIYNQSYKFYNKEQ